MNRISPLLQEEVQTNEELEKEITTENTDIKTDPVDITTKVDTEIGDVNCPGALLDPPTHEVVDGVCQLIGVITTGELPEDLTGVNENIVEEAEVTETFYNPTLDEIINQYKNRFPSDSSHLHENFYNTLSTIENNEHWLLNPNDPENNDINNQYIAEIFREIINPKAFKGGNKNIRGNVDTSIDISTYINDLMSIGSEEEFFEALLLGTNRYDDIGTSIQMNENMLQHHAKEIETFASNSGISMLEAYYQYDCTVVTTTGSNIKEQRSTSAGVTDNCRKYANARYNEAKKLYGHLQSYQITGEINNLEAEEKYGHISDINMVNPTSKNQYYAPDWMGIVGDNEFGYGFYHNKKVDKFVKSLIESGGYDEGEGDLKLLFDFVLNPVNNITQKLGLNSQAELYRIWGIDINVEGLADEDFMAFKLLFEPSVFNDLPVEGKTAAIEKYIKVMDAHYNETVNDPYFVKLLEEFGTSPDQMILYRNMFKEQQIRVNNVMANWEENERVHTEIVKSFFGLETKSFNKFMKENYEVHQQGVGSQLANITGDDFHLVLNVDEPEINEQQAINMWIEETFGKEHLKYYKEYLATGLVPEALMKELGDDFESHRLNGISMVQNDILQEFGWKNLRLEESVKEIILHNLPYGEGDGLEILLEKYERGLQDEIDFKVFTDMNFKEDIPAFDQNGNPIIYEASKYEIKGEGGFPLYDYGFLDEGPVYLKGKGAEEGRWFINGEHRILGYRVLEDGSLFNPFEDNSIEKTIQEKADNVNVRYNVLSNKRLRLDKDFNTWGKVYGDKYAEFSMLGAEINALELVDGKWEIDGEPLSLTQLTYYQGVWKKLSILEKELDGYKWHEDGKSKEVHPILGTRGSWKKKPGTPNAEMEWKALEGRMFDIEVELAAINEYVGMNFDNTLINQYLKNYDLSDRLGQQLIMHAQKIGNALTLGQLSRDGVLADQQEYFQKYYPGAYKMAWGDTGLFALGNLIDSSGTILNTAMAFIPGGVLLSASMSAATAYGGQYETIQSVKVQGNIQITQLTQMLLDNEEMTDEKFKATYGRNKLSPAQVKSKRLMIDELEEQVNISEFTQQFSSLWAGGQAFLLEKFISIPLVKGTIPFSGVGTLFTRKVGDSFLTKTAKIVLEGGTRGMMEFGQENIETILENANTMIATGNGALLDGIVVTNADGSKSVDWESQIKMLMVILVTQAPSNLGSAKNLITQQYALTKDRIATNKILTNIQNLQNEIKANNEITGPNSKLSQKDLLAKKQELKEEFKKLEVANAAPILRLQHLTQAELKSVNQDVLERSKLFQELYELGLSGEIDNKTKKEKQDLVTQIEALSLKIQGQIEVAQERSIPESPLSEKELKDRNGEGGRRVEGEYLHGLYDVSKAKVTAHVTKAGGEVIDVNMKDFTKDPDGNEFDLEKGENIVRNEEGEVVDIIGYIPTNQNLFEFYTKKRGLSKDQANAKIKQLFINALTPGGFAKQDGKADVILFNDNIFNAIYNTGQNSVSLLDAEIAAISVIHELFHVNHQQQTIKVTEKHPVTGKEIIVERKVTDVLNTESGKNQAKLAVQELDKLMEEKFGPGSPNANPEILDSYKLRKKAYKGNDYYLEEVMNMIGDFVTLGHINPRDFNIESGFGLSVKQMINGVSNRLTGNNVFHLHDFKSKESVMQYISDFSDAYNANKISYVVLEDDEEEGNYGSKESKVGYGNEKASLLAQKIAIALEYKEKLKGVDAGPKRRELENERREKTKVLTEQIATINKNLEISKQNEITFSVLEPYKQKRNQEIEALKLQKQMLEDNGDVDGKLEDITKLINTYPKDDLHRAAEGDLIEQNAGIIETFINRHININGVARDDFRQETMKAVLDLINTFDPTTQVDDGKGGTTNIDFGYYLRTNLTHRFSGILQKLSSQLETTSLDEKREGGWEPSSNIDDNIENSLGGDGLVTEVVTSDLRKGLDINEDVRKEIVNKVAKLVKKEGIGKDKKQTRKDLEEQFSKEFENIINEKLKTKGSDEANTFLRANKELIIKTLAVKYKRNFRELSFVIKKRATVEETERLKADPNYNGFIESSTAGNTIYGVYQFTDPDATMTLPNGDVVSTYMSEQDFVDIFTQGRNSETRFKQLKKRLGAELGHDAIFDGIRVNNPDDIDNYLLYYTELGKRDPSMKFSRVSPPDGYAWEDLKPNVFQAISVIKNLKRSHDDIIDLDQESPNFMTFFRDDENLGNFSDFEISVAIDILSSIDPSKIDMTMIQFKKSIMDDPDVSQEYKDIISGIPTKKNVEDLKDFRGKKSEQVNNFALNYIGKDKLSAFPDLAELFGYRNGNLDPAAGKQEKAILDNPLATTAEDGVNPCIWQIKSGANGPQVINGEKVPGKFGVRKIEGWVFDKNLGENGAYFQQIPGLDGEIETRISTDPITEFGAEVAKGSFHDAKNTFEANANSSSLDTEVDLDKVRPMNKSLPLFKKIEDILKNGENGDLSRETKLRLLRSIAPEVNAANIHNKKLAVEIVRDLITSVSSGEMDVDVFLEILQSQSGIVKGLRALSSLDFITVLDGEQDMNSYGEHIQPNVKLMLAIELVMRNNIEFNSDGSVKGLKEGADLEGDLTAVFADLRQLFTSKSIAGLLDKDVSEGGGGKTWNVEGLSAMDRLKLLEGTGHLDDLFSIDGVPYLEQVINIETQRVVTEETNRIKLENEQNRVTEIDKTIQRESRIQRQMNGEFVTFGTYDFDQTLETGGTNVIKVTHPDPNMPPIENIPGHDFHSVVADLTAKGYEFDFSDFSRVIGSEPGLLFDKLKKDSEGKYGDKISMGEITEPHLQGILNEDQDYVRVSEDTYILTARQPESAIAIQAFMLQNGVYIPLDQIVGLGETDPETGKPITVTPEMKAQWIKENLYDQGYATGYFVDDGQLMVDAVAEMMDQQPNGGKSVLADPNYSVQHEKFSKSGRSEDSETFNVILEEVTKGSVTREKSYSTARAKLEGSRVKGYNNIIPYSAEDFRGLIYQFLPEGKDGEYALSFFEEKLIKPFSRAEIEITKDKKKVTSQFKNLLESQPEIRSSLKNTVNRADGTPTTFTVDHAVRVYLWSKNGIDIPGLSDRDLQLLKSFVESDPSLQAFADQLGVISNQDEGYITPGNYWMVESLSNDISQIINVINRDKHLQQFNENSKEIFSEENMNKLEVIYGAKFVEAMRNMLDRMETGTSRGKDYSKQDRVVQEWNDWINGSVGATMFFNVRSGLLQTISTTNYLEVSGPNNIAAAAAAFANQPQFWSDWLQIWNSDYLVSRREGEARGINESELRAAAEKGGAKGALAYLLNLGFTPTRLADSFAIATGGATYVRNYTNTISDMMVGWRESGADAKTFFSAQNIFTEGDFKYHLENSGIPGIFANATLEQNMKNLTDEQIEDIAYKLANEKFIMETESGQQSSRQDMLSSSQTGNLGRVILAFKNAPMQYTRKVIRASQDIKNGRGNLKDNLATIAHYGIVQNLMFNGLQKALFAALGEDDEEWEKKSDDVIQGMINSILEGAGLTGAVIVTVKNGILEYQEQEDKGWNADHGYTILQFANLSPTIGSKLREIYSAIKTKQYNADEIAEMDLWDPQNPEWQVVASIITAFTNIPTDRVVSYMNSLIAASSDENEWWQRMALIMGYNTYDVNVETKVDKISEELNIKKKKEKKQTNKEEAISEVEIDVEEEIEEQKEQEKEGKKVESVKCAYVNSSNKRCGLDVEKAGDKCQYHTDDKESIKQCSTIRTNGKRCSEKTTNKSGRCHYHPEESK